MGFPSFPSAQPAEGRGSFFLNWISTFPMATADVDISRMNLSSPRDPGAATEIGLVPNIVVAERVGLTNGDVLVEEIPIRPSLTAISVYLVHSK